VNTKVDVRFLLKSAAWLPSYTRERLQQLYPSRITQEGEFVVTSERGRTQKQNYDDCLHKIFDFIVKASETPSETSEETKRRVADLAHKANEKRLHERKLHSLKKQRRSRPDD